MDNAESVRQVQPRVELWQPWEEGISFLEGGNSEGVFEPMVSKQTLGWH
jgi:hypothetical protein